VSFTDEDSHLSQDIADADPAIAGLLRAERDRQAATLEMIASENFVSIACLQAAGSVLTNKYAEGLPGKRYYGGCEVVDEVEELAIGRAKELFGPGAVHVNVQPHSGASANQAAYAAVMSPGDTAMGLTLAHGGHLTHGHKVSFSGRIYDFHQYGVRPDDHRVDMDQVRDMARQLKPKVIVVGASAYPRHFDFAAFREICDGVGAMMIVDIAHIAGLVVADVHPSPVGIADIVTTTTHKTLRGPRAGIVISKTQELGAAVDKAVFPNLQGGPLMHIIAAKAVAFHLAMSNEFRQNMAQVVRNAAVLADALVGGGLELTTGGTDNHLMLIDLSRTPLTGQDAEDRLHAAGITVNKNAVPFDVRPPMVTSGVRIGTPALTTRGFGEDEMREVAEIILAALTPERTDADLAELAARSASLGDRFPLYPQLARAGLAVPS
jgi:glycine hydroxymethyltransferase